MKTKFKILFWIVVIITILLSIFSIIEYRNKQSILNDIKTYQDSMITYKTKDGKNAAEIRVLQGSRDELLEVVKSKDKEVYNLIKENKNLKSITSVKTETRIDTTTIVDSFFVQKADSSLNIKDSVYIVKNISNEHYDANVRIINDSIKLGFIVYNRFHVIPKEKSNGFLKPKSLIVEVINDNPYTITTGMSSFEIKKQPKFVVPKIVAAVAVVVGTIILIK
jgi:hypothetical protein